MAPIFVPHFPRLAGLLNARLTPFGIEGQFHYVGRPVLPLSLFRLHSFVLESD